MPFTVLYVGAHFNNANANYGVFYFNRNTESNSNNNLGGRLLSKSIRRRRSLPLGKKHLEQGTV